MNENSFIIEQKTLQSLLAAMQPICSKRTTLDITESILFEVTPRELTLKATDLDISLQSTAMMEENNIEQAKFLVSGKRIFELVKELDDKIQFTVSDTQLKLHSKGVDLALNIRDADDFPPFPERIENFMQLESDFMLTMLNKVAFLIPQNNSNAALNGMLLEFNDKEMAMVATDGHCLARITTAECSFPENKSWLLPKRAVLEVKKLLESSENNKIFLGMCGNQLVFSGANFNFFTKVLSDKFPEYKPVMNKQGFMPATLVKGDVVKSLKRANCLLAGQFISTKFQFKPGKLDVSVKNKDVGALEESLHIDRYEGSSIESRFYSPYLLNGLSVFPDKDIEFFVKNNQKPIIFESQQDKYHFTYLVMPVSATQQ